MTKTENKHIEIIIPDYVIIILAKTILPEIQSYYNNIEGKEPFVQSYTEDENESSLLAA